MMNRTNESYDIITKCVKILGNMLCSDEYNIRFLLEYNLMSCLQRLLEWNTPQKDYFSPELEAKIMLCFNNLVNSNSFEFGKPLISGGFQHILDRFVEYLSVNDKSLKREILLLIGSLMNNLDVDCRYFLINNYELIPTLIRALNVETSATAVEIEL